MTDRMRSPSRTTRTRGGRRRASAFHAAQRARRWRRAALRAATVVAAAAVALVAIVGAVTPGLGGLQAADRGLLLQPLPSDTLLYDRSGQVVIADLHPPGYQHYELPIDAMGRYLPMATVAIEDASFWNEPGVSPRSMARAALTDAHAHAVIEGGSTITQQLVKQRLVGGDPSLGRKLREAALALRISTEFSKPQILDMYLDATFYGNTAYGAETAARIYFHRPAAELDLAQAALLAGLPQSPTRLDPLTHWADAKERQREVLDAMVRVHDITPAEAAQASAEDLSPPGHLFGPVAVDLAPAFVSYVTRELERRFGSDAVLRSGLRVVTSLDWNLQQLGQDAVTEAVNANRWRSLTDGALVSIDPQTGQVLALVGSAGYRTSGEEYDMAAGPPRNPGSAFKMFTYTAAISSRRFTMVTPIEDQPITVRLPGSAPYSPENYGQHYYGACRVQECLGNSLNVPAVQVEVGTGIAAVVDAARRPLHDGRSREQLRALADAGRVRRDAHPDGDGGVGAGGRRDPPPARGGHERRLEHRSAAVRARRRRPAGRRSRNGLHRQPDAVRPGQPDDGVRRLDPADPHRAHRSRQDGDHRRLHGRLGGRLHTFAGDRGLDGQSRLPPHGARHGRHGGGGAGLEPVHAAGARPAGTRRRMVRAAAGPGRSVGERAPCLVPAGHLARYVTAAAPGRGVDGHRLRSNEAAMRGTWERHVDPLE